MNVELNGGGTFIFPFFSLIFPRQEGCGRNGVFARNHTTPEAYNSLQKVFKKELKHNPIHKVDSSLQKVLEKEGKTKIEKCNHPTPQVPQFLSEST